VLALDRRSHAATTRRARKFDLDASGGPVTPSNIDLAGTRGFEDACAMKGAIGVQPIT
jgi:hypothetical protein